MSVSLINIFKMKSEAVRAFFLSHYFPISFIFSKNCHYRILKSFQMKFTHKLI